MPLLSKLSRLDYCALGLAFLLSFGCAARGLVYDSFLVIALCFFVPLMWMSFNSVYKVHALMMKATITGVIIFALWVLGQSFLVDSFNQAAWLSSICNVILVALVAVIALQVGASSSASHLFISGVLFFNILLVSLTFLAYRSGLSLHPDYYSHGLVNPNNAASYLGVMLIVAISQFSRVTRHFMKRSRKGFFQRLESLKLSSALQILLICFGCFLFLAGLFLTGSRGGVALSLLVVMGLIILFFMKREQKGFLTFIIFGGVGFLVLATMVSQFSAELIEDLSKQGLDGDVRPELFAAIIPMIADQPFFGHGLGSFYSHFQSYRSAEMPVEGLYDKAHSHYLELAAEMGLFILAVVLLGAFILLRQFIIGLKQHKRHHEIPAMGLAVLVLMGLHSTFDFPLQIPGILVLTLAILLVSAVQSDKAYLMSRANKVKPLKK